MSHVGDHEETPADRALARIDAAIELLFRERREVLAHIPRDDARGGSVTTMSVPVASSAIGFASLNVTSIFFGEELPKLAMRLVRVRRCGKDEATHLGVYIGDFPTALGVSYHHRSGGLAIKQAFPLPHIVVPALGEVLVGSECWWQALAPGEALSDLTDLEIAEGFAELLRRTGL